MSSRRCHFLQTRNSSTENRSTIIQSISTRRAGESNWVDQRTYLRKTESSESQMTKPCKTSSIWPALPTLMMYLKRIKLTSTSALRRLDTLRKSATRWTMQRCSRKLQSTKNTTLYRLSWSETCRETALRWSLRRLWPLSNQRSWNSMTPPRRSKHTPTVRSQLWKPSSSTSCARGLTLPAKNASLKSKQSLSNNSKPKKNREKPKMLYLSIDHKNFDFDFAN